jgi:hypothetical protein
LIAEVSDWRPDAADYGVLVKLWHHVTPKLHHRSRVVERGGSRETVASLKSTLRNYTRRECDLQSVNIHHSGSWILTAVSRFLRVKAPKIQARRLVFVKITPPVQNRIGVTGPDRLWRAERPAFRGNPGKFDKDGTPLDVLWG